MTSGIDPVYEQIRNSLVLNPSYILDLEQEGMEKIFVELENQAQQIRADFDGVINLSDYWIRYAPIQRGHKPSGNAFPWGEVGEKVLEGYLYSFIRNCFQKTSFIGLPYGHDVRFKTDKAFIHIDVKSTGPTDNPNEVVSSPNQVTGDGAFCDSNGVFNSSYLVTGPARTMQFQPELPPFYVIDGGVFITLTYYLKCVYSVRSLGDQPLGYLELICVPNGLLMFDGPKYADNVPGLLTPGKDEQKMPRKRTRIKLDPLAKFQEWRCRKIIYTDTGYTVASRLQSPDTDDFIHRSL